MSQQINLFNPIFLKRKRYFSALAMMQALAIVAAGNVALYAYTRHQAANLREIANATERQVKERRTQLVKLSAEFSSQGRSKVIEEQLAAAEAQLKRRQALLESMARGAGGDAGGFARYLRALAQQATPGVWLTGVSIDSAAGRIVIHGRGLQSELVPAYLRSLSSLPPFAGKAVSELRISAQAPASGGQQPGPGDVLPGFVEFSVSLPVAIQAAGPAS